MQIESVLLVISRNRKRPQKVFYIAFRIYSNPIEFVAWLVSRFCNFKLSINADVKYEIFPCNTLIRLEEKQRRNTKRKIEASKCTVLLDAANAVCIIRYFHFIYKWERRKPLIFIFTVRYHKAVVVRSFTTVFCLI